MSAELTSNPTERQYHEYYSPERKAEVLALLDANAGNLKRTAHDTGINPETIRYWIQNKERYSELQPRKLADLASLAESNAHLLGNSIANHDLESANLSQKATAFGIMIDKMQLLRGLPTNITESIDRQDITLVLQSALDDAIDVTPE